MKYSFYQNFSEDFARTACVPLLSKASCARTTPGHEVEMMEILDNSQPIGRMGHPCEVAALALFLCSKEAAFVTGTDYPMDGGFLNLR